MIVSFRFHYLAKFAEWQKELLLKYWPDKTFKEDDTLEHGFEMYECHVDLAFAFAMRLDDLTKVERTRYPGEPEESAAPVPRAGNNSPINHLTQIMVPGPALFSVNDVMLLSDICTDELIRHMKEGWRIVAVCMQPDQRRPDYIMGRIAGGTIINVDY